MGSNSFGMALVAGKNLVPKPATGKTALRSLVMENTQKLKGWLDARYIKNSRSSISELLAHLRFASINALVEGDTSIQFPIPRFAVSERCARLFQSGLSMKPLAKP